MGRGSVLGRFTSSFSDYGIALLFIDRFFTVELTPSMIIGLTSVLVVACWVLGYFWINSNLDRIEGQISQERNLLVDEIHKAIVKERESL